MNLSAKDLQGYIVIVMRRAYPHTRRHADVAAEIKRIYSFDDLCRVALNMNSMVDKTLELVRDGSDYRSETKKYRLKVEVLTA